ncbi:MAG: hypothetical protein VZS44_09045 [Bacilli bacterium]|nr:hypothetical protein [Bacilli bacterium]
MKKIVSNVLIVSTQLIIGALFLVMLFSNNKENNSVVVVENDNLNKMADAVSELFVEEEAVKPKIDETKQVDLITEEQRKAREEAKRVAEEKAKAEAEAKAKAEAEAKAKAEAEARAKAEAERAAAAAAVPVTSLSALQSYAHNLVVGSYGWTEADFSALINLWNRESGWRVTAANGSGAYGIPQALPGSKMASEGADWATNGETQIRWGLKYIKSTYGSPSAAWAAFLSKGWY